MLARCLYGSDEHVRLFALRDLACLRLHSASDRELEDFPRCLVLTGSSTSSTLAIEITVASSMLARCASSTPCSTSVYHAPLGFRGSKSWTGTRSSSSAYPRTSRSTCTAVEERIDSDVTAYIGTDMCGAVQRRHRSRHKARYPRRCFLNQYLHFSNQAQRTDQRLWTHRALKSSACRKICVTHENLHLNWDL